MVRLNLVHFRFNFLLLCFVGFTFQFIFKLAVIIL